MSPAACAAVTGWLGWAAGLAGIAGSLLLVRPLFLLLRQREAIETIAHGRVMGTIPPAFQKRIDRAEVLLGTETYDGREGWKNWAHGGIAALVVAAGLLALQAIYLACS